MKTALVMEGGALRCMFTAGVVDVIMEQKIQFDAVFGVSAGSLTGINYVSGQKYRTKRVNVDFAQETRYLGMRAFLKYDSVFNFDFLFSEISDIYLPLDKVSFMNSTTDFTACATSLDNGKPEYFNKHSCPDIFKAVRAGSSMPILSPPVELSDGRLYLDGGVSCAIPYQIAIDQGYEKILVIPTRQHGFLKPFVSKSLGELYLRSFYKYPKFLKAMLDTPRMYRNQMTEIDQLEYKRRIMVIRPEVPITIPHTERDTTQLLKLYDEGRRVGEKNLASLKEYLHLPIE